jgi:hypothetical protein
LSCGGKNVRGNKRVNNRDPSYFVGHAEELTGMKQQRVSDLSKWLGQGVKYRSRLLGTSTVPPCLRQSPMSAANQFLRSRLLQGSDGTYLGKIHLKDYALPVTCTAVSADGTVLGIRANQTEALRLFERQFGSESAVPP